MIEKVNPSHPDKVADRIAGAIVDLAYSKTDNPKIAVEVLIGHGYCVTIIETSINLPNNEVADIIHRIAGHTVQGHIKQVPQDPHLAANQADQVRCGDNGIFKGCPVTDEEIENETEGESKPRQKSKAPCMLLFCAFEQLQYYIELGQRYGFKHYIPLVFRKNFSAQVLKANMKIVGCCEYGLVLYKDKLPKFNNRGNMIMNCFDWPRDTETPKIHPTQKPVRLLERLIEIFTDPNDVVIDPTAGSGSSLLAAAHLGRRAYGFEIKKDFFKLSQEKIMPLARGARQMNIFDNPEV